MRTRRVGALGAAGLAAHSFVDGLGDRPRLRRGHDDGDPRLPRRHRARLRRRAQHGQLRPAPVERPPAGDPLARARRGRAARRSHRRARHSPSPSTRSGCCSPRTSASSSTWARPTCCRTRTSTRRRGACSSRSWGSARSSRSASSRADPRRKSQRDGRSRGARAVLWTRRQRRRSHEAHLPHVPVLPPPPGPRDLFRRGVLVAPRPQWPWTTAGRPGRALRREDRPGSTSSTSPARRSPT